MQNIHCCSQVCGELPVSLPFLLSSKIFSSLRKTLVCIMQSKLDVH